MRIKLLSANFSGTGLGSTDWIRSFAQRTGITDPAKISAMRALYDSSVSAGFWTRIGGMAFFPGSTQETQKYIFKDVALGVPFPVLTFTGNGSSANGWTPGNGIYAVAPFTPTAGNISEISFGAYNATAETAPEVSIARRSLQVIDSAAPANYNFMLSRYFSSAVKSPIFYAGLASGGNSTFPTTDTYPVTATGFLQGVKQGNTIRLIDNGATVSGTTTASQVPVGGGIHKLVLGAGMSAAGDVQYATGFSLARYTFFYWGQLSLTEAVSFNTIVNTFLTAFGRA